MNFKKYFILGGVALTLGMTSCVGDLDLEPNDPNLAEATDYIGMLGKCYSGLAVSGQTGPDGASDVSGLDGGTGCYSRALFMMNEFPTDECIWIWKDAGVFDLVQNIWDASNGNIYGTYSRLYSHIAVCNDFLRQTANMADNAEMAELRAEARALRAMSYYWAIDIFGNATFVTDADKEGAAPAQGTRAQLYSWLEKELLEIAGITKSGRNLTEGTSAISTTPLYGRVGRDGVEALLARLYLNSAVYTDGASKDYDLCQQVCQFIINRHMGNGFNGTGLASNYHYLFCRDNDQYMPGGSNIDGNEILWGVPYEKDNTRSYGGTQFLIQAAIANNSEGWVMSSGDYGLIEGWMCMHAPKQLSDKFTDDDIRSAMWLKEESGFQRNNDEYSEFTNGYAVIKFTNLYSGNAGALTWPTTTGFWSERNGGKYDLTGSTQPVTEVWVDTDLPLIRLADVYLMYTECYILGNTGSQADALQYVNYVRQRAGLADWISGDLNADNILDERARELYWELTRRSDLIRHEKFTGNSYNWAWKGGVLEGTRIPSYYNLMPIPTNILAAQSDFKQNTGYN